MFEVELNGKKVKADVTFYTAWVYEAEFQSKLVQDYMKSQSYTESEDGEGGKVLLVDFESVDWLTITRVLWAAIKTAKESTPGYEDWIRKTGGADFLSVRSDLDKAISDCFFRS